MNIIELSEILSTEDKAREFLEQKRWHNKRTCPHCKSEKSYTLTPKSESKSPVRKGVYKCADCRKQFTVTVGTIFEESKIGIRKWLMAIHLFVSSKKGVSAKEIEREIGVTYKTAWFLCHRLREAMQQQNLSTLLGGSGKTVEADETYVGGKAKRNKDGKINLVRGRSTQKKSAVAVLVERDGKVRAKMVERVTSKELKGFIKNNVDVKSKIVTDEFKSYIGLNSDFEGGHSIVKHSTGRYVNKYGEHTNTAESFNALVKRAHYGIYHQFSKKHLHRYIDEMTYRWNTRKVTDSERFDSVITDSAGKRLKYKK